MRFEHFSDDDIFTNKNVNQCCHYWWNISSYSVWNIYTVVLDIFNISSSVVDAEHNFIYTQAVTYVIWGYLQWAFHIIIFDKMVHIQ